MAIWENQQPTLSDRDSSVSGAGEIWSMKSEPSDERAAEESARSTEFHTPLQIRSVCDATRRIEWTAENGSQGRQNSWHLRHLSSLPRNRRLCGFVPPGRPLLGHRTNKIEKDSSRGVVRNRQGVYWPSCGRGSWRMRVSARPFAALIRPANLSAARFEALPFSTETNKKGGKGFASPTCVVGDASRQAASASPKACLMQWAYMPPA